MLARIQKWLAPPDPSPDLRKALKLRTPGTGEWYLRSDSYEKWKSKTVPLTWLYGQAGAGKTFLTAAIIENMQKFCNDDPAQSLAHHFFDFNEAAKQDPINMLKSLLCQSLSRCADVPDAVKSLYASCNEGLRAASEHELLEALRGTFEVAHAFVVLDALDECNGWDALLDILTEMHSWGEKTVSILVTSRKEVYIEEALEDIVPQGERKSLENDEVDKDIGAYVRVRLANDKNFRRWHNDPEIQQDIQTTLELKAQGMY